MTFDLAKPAVQPAVFPQMFSIPGGEFFRGADGFADNPRQRVHVDGFNTSNLIQVGPYKKYVAAAQGLGRYGLFGRNRLGDDVLIGRGHKKELSAMHGITPYVNDHIGMSDLADFSVEEVVPEPDWLEMAIAENELDSIFAQDETPITFVNRFDALAYIQYLNEQLAVERQGQRLLDGGWYALPTAAQLQRLMAGPEGTFAFGTHDGKCPDLTDRPFGHIGLALEQDKGVRWSDAIITGLCGVLWQWTTDRYHQNSNRQVQGVLRNPRGAKDGLAELSGGGSWYDGDGRVLAAVWRYSCDSGYRNGSVGFRVVRPRTP